LYEGLSLSAAAVSADGKTQVTVKVKNTGSRASDEVVQVYVQHLGSSVTRPRLELKEFKRVHVGAGAEQNVTLELKARDLAYWDAGAHAWHVEKEKIHVMAGGSSDQLPVSADLDVMNEQTFRP
jgi:beta-glucosidase